MVKKGSRPAKPACSTMRPPDRRACWAAASSRVRSPGPRLRRAVSSPKHTRHAVDVNKDKFAHDRDTLDQQTLNRAYARWAPIYDIVFGAVFDRGRKMSIEAGEKVGGGL